MGRPMDPYGPPSEPAPGWTPPPPGWVPPPQGWTPTPQGWVPGPAAPEPPPERRRRVPFPVLVVGLVVVAAVVIGVVVAVLARGGDVHDAPGTGGRRLAVPASVPGYRPVAGVHTDDLKASLGEELADKGEDPDAVVRHAVVGVFEPVSGGGTDAGVVVVGLALQDVPAFRAQVRRDGVEATLSFFLAGAGGGVSTSSTAATRFDPGPRGGFLRCQPATSVGPDTVACAWGDESAMALTLVGGTTSLPDAAAITRTFRSAVESG